MVEIIAAGAVLGVLVVVCAQMLSRTAVQQRAIANRRAALQMASNAMERVYALPWGKLDAGNTETIAKAVIEQGMLRGGRLDIVVDESDPALPAKRIRVSVTSNEGSDEVERKQQLTSWRYAEAYRNATSAVLPKASQPPEREQ